MDEEKTEPKQIFLRIKENRSRQANKINARGVLTEFQIVEKVLVRANPSSDATQGIISKFCALYEGPFIVKTRIGKATYELADCEDPNRTRGKFNVRQLKPYNSGS